MTTNHDVHTLTGAYVLDALSDTERRAFEHHMADCPTCRQEVIELRETTARLATATFVPAPPTLWQKVYAAVSTTRQLSPSPDTTMHPARRQTRRWPTRVAVATAAAAGIALTVEPRSGSATPTGNVVLTVPTTS